MSVNDTFRKLKKTFSRQPCQTSSVVFLKSVIAFFFSYAPNWKVSDFDKYL